MTTDPTPQPNADSVEVDLVETDPVEAGITDDDNTDDHRSWWQQPRQLRRQLARTLVFTALASVVLVGGLNFVAARSLLDDGTEDQLVGVGEARARSIELGLDRVVSLVSAMAADLAVVAALEDFNDAFDELSGEALEPGQRADLDEFYETMVVAPLNELGVVGEITLDDVAPMSDEGRYLQSHYIVTEDAPEDRRDVADPGDGSQYSSVHSEKHPQLAALESSLDAADLLLISTAGDIVYTTEKRLDFGTNLVAGPFSDSNLADAVLNGLPRVRPGQAVIADLQLYLPGGAQPVFFAAASIRRETEVIGALVLQIPIAALNTITTAEQEWEKVGLSSGESYVVGSGHTLVSESRLWIEDPAAYLEKVEDPTLSALIEAFDSPVGLQIVDTEPVEVALGGETFSGVTQNYLGQETFSYSTPIASPGVEWVVVADIPLRDARDPLYDYAARLGLVLLLILPVAAIVGVWLADRLTRPIAPVVAAAIAVADGDRDPDVPDLRSDEFGDLARRLKVLASELEQQESALADEYEDRRKLLLTVLPQRMVEANGVLSGTGDVAETATVIAVTLNILSDDVQHDELDATDLLSNALESAEEMAGERGLERVRASSDQYLFLAGIGSDSAQPDTALDFTAALGEMIGGLSSAAEIPLSVHIGVASGSVATGMLQQGALTFAAWGEPVRRALAIGVLSRSDEVLIDVTTVEVADETRWNFVSADDIMDLDGRPMVLFELSPESAVV